jgi:putative ABC transport system ATP-binding protein
LNRDEQATILMVTHDSNAASFCKRILFIQDGVIFHELRRGDESQQEELIINAVFVFQRFFC